MKVSVNWIKEYLDFELPPIDELVTKIGAQLGAVEEVEYLGHKYKNIVVSKVVSCEKHPNADKLNICAIDDGGITPDVNRDENGYIQVVCGAPNVREGLMVAWIPPGGVVPSTYHSDPFTLGSRELRGVMSNGMLASAHELEISDDHAGILEIDEEVVPGQAFADAYKLNDYIIDIENKMFTHRPDCFGQLGVAREIAGILGHKFTSPDWYLQPLPVVKDSQDLPLEINNLIPQLAPRFLAVAIAGTEVRSSPVLLQTYLTRVGIRPINNIVDVTNFVMALTGQPLHAYDYDKVRGDQPIATVNVRHAKEDESLTLLNGKEVAPRKEAIMIANSNKLIAIGGVMGGVDTEVDENTRNIILECANFDMYSIRRTSMAHGLFTDAVTRFSKGQSLAQNDQVMAKAVQLLQQVAGGVVASYASQENTEIYVSKVETSVSFINSRLGLDLSAQEIADMLQNVEFATELDGDIIVCHVPFWRTDIAIAEDIVEEIGRLNGFDKLRFELPVRSATPTQRNRLVEIKSGLRNLLAGAGANEISTYSFVHEELFNKVGQNKENAYRISNAISPDLQYYRLSIVPSLLEKVHSNIKAGHDEFVLFEIGKTHHINDEVDQDGVPAEYVSLGVACANNKSNQPSYYVAKKYLSYIFEHYQITDITYTPLHDADVHPGSRLGHIVAPYDLNRSALITGLNNTVVGVVGEFKSSIRKQLKLPVATASFEVDVEALMKLQSDKSAYTPLSRYPSISQDITLSVPVDVSHASLKSFVVHSLSDNKDEHVSIRVEDKDIYKKSQEDSTKNITFGVTVSHHSKTLKEQEVTALLEQLRGSVTDSF